MKIERHINGEHQLNLTTVPAGKKLPLVNIEYKLIMPEPTQLDRIEAKLDELLAKKAKVVKPRAAKVVYWDSFDVVWKAYPKRAGSNPKIKAFAAFKARSYDDKNEPVWMFDGAKRYAKFCDATGTC